MSTQQNRPQRIWFDGKMWEVSELWDVLKDGGWTETKILEFFEFRLGVGRFAEDKEEMRLAA